MVTGCSSGIGLRTGLALVRKGFHVVATMRAAANRPLPPELAVPEVTVLPLDIRCDDSVRECVEKAGPVDVLVNNAGIAPPNFAKDAPIEQRREGPTCSATSA
jgi:NAD(P)-dependent dehydrogenase (short-subunit alcohol dehydrogenase family)